MIFEGSRYRGGFMYKTLAMSAIVSLVSFLFAEIVLFVFTSVAITNMQNINIAVFTREKQNLISFYLEKKRKAVDKILEQCFQT